MMIKQAIKLKNAFDSYYYKITRFNYDASRNFGIDKIILDNSEMLIKIKSILNFFYITTKYLEDNIIKKVMVHYEKWLLG